MILVIDDDAAMRLMMSRALQLAGHVTVTVADGAAALVEAAAPGIDLVLTDINLVGMDGIELIERLRSGGYAGPIVAISGDSGITGRSLETARHAGADGVLEKPFSLLDLNRLIGGLLPPSANGGGVD